MIIRILALPFLCIAVVFSFALCGKIMRLTGMWEALDWLVAWSDR